ncbi:hypothetical protein IE4872_PC00368 (plasmid) [Rhizobium gallicum]|uniref:Uncharacterized protein n=1 Tax=Rhizobium gallicum TaxID=56730 RepID=A0A1L5NR69_9HYPH|nr:hypothetical protein IE4872_PC00368 [Rhizobium gallicum]
MPRSIFPAFRIKAYSDQAWAGDSLKKPAAAQAALVSRSHSVRGEVLNLRAAIAVFSHLLSSLHF